MSETVVRPELPGFDPFSEQFLRDPFPEWRRAQREAPVFYYRDLDVWIVTKHDDVERAVTDWQTFSSKAVGAGPVPEHLRGRVPDNVFGGSFVSNDPPLHSVSRNAARPAFTRPRVAALEPVIEAYADELIDGFIADGHCDLMTDFCYPLSLQIIVRLLGLPEDRKALYRRTTEDMFALMSPQTQDEDHPYEGPVRPMADAERVERWSRLAEVFDLYRELMAARREDPGGDLISSMVNAVDAEGHPLLGEDRLLIHIHEMIAAGNDTTANLMGSMVLYLSDEPAQLAELVNHPELMENAVEEGLRRRGSSVGMFRLTTADVSVSGVVIPKNSIVWLVFQATGHDEDLFEEPARFDIHRPNVEDHLSFGKGRHFCMGAPLARLEARVALNRLLARIPTIRAVPDQVLHFQPALTVSMLSHLQVEWS